MLKKAGPENVTSSRQEVGRGCDCVLTSAEIGG